MQGFRWRRVADLGEPGHDAIGLCTWRSNLGLRRVWRESFLLRYSCRLLSQAFGGGGGGSGAGATSELFTDVPDGHPYAAIEQLYYSGIIVGFLRTAAFVSRPTSNACSSPRCWCGLWATSSSRRQDSLPLPRRVPGL